MFLSFRQSQIDVRLDRLPEPEGSHSLFLSLIWSVPEKLIYGSSSLLDLSEMDNLVSARIGIWH